MDAKVLLTSMNMMDYSYQLIINEQDEFYYLDPMCQHRAGSLNDFQYKIVKIVTQHFNDGQKIALFEYKDGLIGWFIIKNSIQLLNKKNEHILVDLEFFKSPEINHRMNIKADLTLAFRNFNLMSKYFIIIDDKVLEAIYSGTRFLGFADAEVISRSKLIALESFLKPTQTKLFATAKCDEEIIGADLDYELPIYVEEIFPKTSVVKIRQGNMTGWINAYELEVTITEEEHEYTLDERMIEHFLITYEEERARHKTIIKKLLNESLTLRSRLIKIDKKLTRTDELYTNLKNSKLGRMQIAFWQHRRKG